jgi:SAM-dependent methyltransferase
VVIIGAGDDPVYSRLLRPYSGIIRYGLSHRARTDVRCDVCDLAIGDGEVDMILSSSVLEHVYDPDRAVSEMYRALKTTGYVYAEIPFLRAYHMIPQDYQRYTISGIRRLFERQGFSTIDVGICSGPFTAMVLFVTDFVRAALSFNRPIQTAGHLALSLALHPIKYLDRLIENAEWAEVCACNFYYLGEKMHVENDA